MTWDMAMYHWEADQEDFLVVDGEAAAHRRGRGALRAWDFLHCPTGTKHTIVGSGGPIVIAVGAREHQDGPTGADTPSTTSPPHEVGVERRRTTERGVRADLGETRQARHTRTARTGSRPRAPSGPDSDRRYANMCSFVPAATILHADLDAFFASVEQRDDRRFAAGR